MMGESCGNCRFAGANLLGSSDMRWCRFRPPSVVVVSGWGRTMWPTVAAADWCGEWAPLGALPPTPENIRAALDAADQA